MFCLDGRPSFQKFSLSPSYLAEVVLSLSLTTCSTWQEWHSQQCPRRPKVCMDFGSEKKGSELPFPEVKKLSDCVWAPIAFFLFMDVHLKIWFFPLSKCYYSASDGFQQRLSSPRAKCVGPKGLGAERDRAVNGRRCPHRWGGGRVFCAPARLFF